MGFSRRLWSTPLLAADFHEEYEERAASWWELFVDLLLVVTCSSIAESLEEDVSLKGFVAFIVTFTLFFHGWNLYTQYSSRFIDNSLLHSFQLFLYLLATSAMVTNTNGFAYAQHFATCAALQRGSVFLMVSMAYILIPRVRSFIHALTVNYLVSICLCTAAAVSDAHQSQLFLALAAVWEGALSFPVFWFIRTKIYHYELIALNIDHNAERFGCLVMVVLGESIVSALFDYHRSGLDPAQTPLYLAAMALSLSLTFSLGLVCYAVQPPRAEHALRRSVWAAYFFNVGHLLLCSSLLAVGVGVKLAMHAVLKPSKLPSNAEEAVTQGLTATLASMVAAPTLDGSVPMLSPDAAWLMFGATSTSLFSVLLIRLAHYGGREPKPTDPPQVKAGKLLWWLGFVVAALVPLVVGAVVIPRGGGVHAVHALEVVVGIVGGFVLAETAAVHWMAVTFDKPQCGGGEKGEGAGEREDEVPLLRADARSSSRNDVGPGTEPPARAPSKR